MKTIERAALTILVADMFLGGKSKAEVISEIPEISRPTLSKIAKEVGVNGFKRGRKVGLSEKAIEIVKFAYANHGKTLKEIGKVFGVSHQRVSQILNPEKHRSRALIAYNVSVGKIIKPLVCDGCGKVKKLEAHHEDYSKPLDVSWLCKKCHSEKPRERAANKMAAVTQASNHEQFNPSTEL